VSPPTLVVAFRLLHATPFEILVAASAGIAVIEDRTRNAASATEVLRNIESSRINFNSQQLAIW
jgi:hypothetical protein